MSISSSFRFLTFVAALGVIGVPSLRGEIVTGTYVGDGGGIRGWLTRPENWSGQEVPGVRTYTDEDKSVVTNGDFGGTMIFSTVGGAGGTLYCDMSGTNLYSTFQLVFRGDIPQYTFADWANLRIEAGGGLYVEEDCAYPPIFSENGSAITIREAAPDNRTIHISNDSANPIVLNRNGPVWGAVGHANASGYYTGGDAAPPIYSMEGKGEIRWGQAGTTDETGGIPVYEIRHTGEGKTVFCSKGNNLRANWIAVPPAETLQRIVFEPGSDGKPHEVFIRSTNDQFVVMSDTEISGSGIVEFGYGRSTPGFFCVSNGVTCTFTAALWNYNNNSGGASTKWTCNGTTMNEFLPYGVRGGGRLVLVDGVTSNAVKGAAWVTDGSTLESSKIGLKGKGSPLGTGDRIWLSKGGRFAYTGAGETSDRVICHMEGGGVFESAAAGELKIAALCGATDGSVLTLSNLTQNALVVTGAITNRTTAMSTTVVKAGEGPMRIEGTVGANCTVRVVEGQLTVVSTSDVKGEVALADGATLAVSGAGAKVGSVSVSGGTGVLSVPNGAKVTVGSFPNNAAGTLDVRLEGNGELTVTGASGLAPVWVKVNGKAASFDAGGKIQPLAITGHVDAHGGVIPDDAAAAVVIDEAVGPKDEHVTLEKPATSVAYLQQLQPMDPAFVEIVSGGSFAASALSVALGAKPLTIGLEPSVGAFKVNGTRLQLETSGEGHEITINPPVNIARGGIVTKTGPGSASFESGFSGGFPGADFELNGAFSFENSKSGSDAYFRLEPLDGEPYKVHFHGEMTPTQPGELRLDNVNLALTGDGTGTVGNVVLSGNSELVWSGPALTTYQLNLKNQKPPTNTWAIGSAGSSIVRFTDGAYTGKLEVANGDDWSSSVAIYQSGGEICNVINNYDCEESLGMKGYAYYELTGGQLTVAGALMTAGSPGDLVMAVHGGTVYFTPTSVRRSRFANSSKDSRATINVQYGGYFDNSQSSESTFMPMNNRQNADSDVTVANGGTVYFCRNLTGIGFGWGTRYTPSNVNINEGGTILAGSLVRYTTVVVKSDDFPEGVATDKRYTNAWATVNFNGGTYESSYSGGYLFGRSQNTSGYPPSRVLAYEKGAIISRPVPEGTSESAAENIWCGIGKRGVIRAPEGQGVYEIGMDDYMRETRFIGSPVVTIEGDGKGATAYADFDSSLGRVTNVTVTCHGENYTRAEALVYRNGSVVTRLPVTLRQNVSGGMTKIGGGQLRIYDTSTYTGATCIREGTVKAYCASPFSPESRLRLEGGKLIMQSYAQTFADFDYTAGSISGTLPKITGIVVDMTEVAEGHVKHVCTQTPGGAKLVEYTTAHPPLTLVNVDRAKLTSNRYTLVEFADLAFAMSVDTSKTNIPPGWRLGLAGNTLKMTRDRGMIIMLRKHKQDY